MLSLFLLFISFAHSLPMINSDIANVACMISEAGSIDEVRRDRNGDLRFCSGTFISPNLFLTAAHCLEERPNRFGLFKKDFKKQIFISCPGEQYFKTVASIPNLLYFNDSDFNSSGEIEINFSGVKVNNRSSDLAVLVVNSELRTNFPALPKNSSRFSSCKILGYSPYRCATFSGEGCLRHLEFDTSADFMATFGPKGSSSLHRGDSGSGVLCEQNGIQNLIGVYVSSQKGAQIVNLNYHRNFIENLKSLTRAQLLEKATAIKMSQAEWEVFEKKEAVENIAGSKLIFFCSDNASACSKPWDLYAMITRDAGLMKALLGKNVGTISFWPQSTEKVSINSFDDNRLVINSQATLDDIRQFINTLP